VAAGLTLNQLTLQKGTTQIGLAAGVDGWHNGLVMNSIANTVLVLGAGFTRAFVPEAPLLFGDFCAEELDQRFARFPRARDILTWERQRDPQGQGRINLERLMTRLDSGMPYDEFDGSLQELTLLLSELLSCFIRLVDEARGRSEFHNELLPLATYCINNAVDCVTFNYDDVLDEVLYSVRQPPPGRPVSYWHPNGGYGLFCRPSLTTISGLYGDVMHSSTIQLLKLHGSMNWRIRVSNTGAASPDNIVHHEPWYPYEGQWFSGFRKDSVEGLRFEAMIEGHLQRDPFIVPPVLTKSSIIAEPILRIVWKAAREKLLMADRVIFVGYSLPITDIAARTMFSECIRTTADIRVVGYTPNSGADERLITSYREIWPDLADEQFDFAGAREWARQFTAG
jgi:hypothetical protein